jgi:hypothetical protein
MLAIVCGPTGFAVVIALESGCRFNSGYYVSKMLTLLSESWRERWRGDFRKVIAYADNVHPHEATVSQQFMARNAMVVAADPPYSADLAPSDFYLFGRGRFEDRRKVALTKVFLEWMRRLERCIETNGDYFG